MNQEQIDIVVNKILEHVQDLEPIEAELVTAHAYFSVLTSIAVEVGVSSHAKIRNVVTTSLNKFLEVNPLPIREQS